MEPSAWGITGPTVPEGYMQIRGPGPPRWESPESDTVKYGHESRGIRT
jgi:hypothetical protein